MTFTTFTNSVPVEVILGSPAAVPEPGEQAKMWGHSWPRLAPRPRPHLVRNVDGYAVEVHEGTGPFKPPHLRVIKGGKS
jgi:hypothetical protein